MRRKDREITDLNKIIEIIKKCDVCSLAMFDDEYPYVIPLNFGMDFDGEQITLYFHCAKEGKKLDLIRRNNKVAFEMNCSHKLILGHKACGCTMEYESVCGRGVAEILDGEEKIKALRCLMKQYTNKEEFEFIEKQLKVVGIFKVTVTEICGKAAKV